MKLSTAVSDFVRSIFGREQKMIQDLSIANRNLVAGQKLGGASLPGIDVDTLGRIEDSVGLDRRRLYRYVDYEEMDDYGAIAAILDIYADDAAQIDSSTRKTVWAECQDVSIKTDLDNLFTKRLKMEENAWEIIRSLCKYGDELEEIVVGDIGVVGLNYLPASTMHRIEEQQNGLKGFVQSYDPSININPAMFDKMRLDQGEAASPQGHELLYEDWRVAHMRLRSQSRGSLYGRSISDAARWTWKRLLLLEDAVLVFKLTRSPSRYIFYIDVADMPTKQAEAKIQEVKRRIKKRKFINPKTGKPDFRFSPLSMDEDFFLGVRDGKESTRIDTLNGPSYQQVEDVQYFLHKLYSDYKVPRAYMGDDSNMPSRATLCISGDTKIPLLDGTCPTIKELSKRKEPFWVYSMDKDNNVVPALAKDARVTRKRAKTVDLELDNGEIFGCTPDHLIMMKGGGYEEAGKLKKGDSAMPFFRRKSSGKGEEQKTVNVAAIRLGPVIDTYDLTVDEHHNFAIQAGMFIHNSSEDVQFCRIVLRVQREFRNGMHKVGRVHLAARKIDPMAVDFNIAMTVPSSIFELGQLEVKRARADLASTMERHVSLYWLLSNVYGLPDGEIGEVMKQKEAEAKKATEMGGMESMVRQRGNALYEPNLRTLGNYPLVPLSERELLEGNRRHEKELENKIKDLMGKTESRLGAKLKETGYLIRDIAAAAKK